MFNFVKKGSSRFDRFIVAVFSDTHAGHKLGLVNPNTTFVEYDEEGQEYPEPVMVNKAQEFLWDLHMGHVQSVSDIADGDPIVIIHNGDLAVGKKYSDQLVYSATSNQVIMAIMNMLPLVSLPNAKVMRLSYGTQSHEFFEGTVPRLVLRDLNSSFPEKDIKMVKHGLLDIGGIRIDYSHHGPYTGSRQWLKGNVARYQLRSDMMAEISAGNQPPDVYLRGHYHERIEEHLVIFANGMDYRSSMLLTPSYQLLGDFAQQATRSTPRVTNGMVAIEVINGTIHRNHWLVKTSDIRTKENIQI